MFHSQQNEKIKYIFSNGGNGAWIEFNLHVRDVNPTKYNASKNNINASKNITEDVALNKSHLRKNEENIERIEANKVKYADTKENEYINGFDCKAGKIWVYPTNLPIRKYQMEIVESCLFKNTVFTFAVGKILSFENFEYQGK